MTRPAPERRLTNVRRILGRKISESAQRCHLDVRLVPERDHPVGQSRTPSIPPRGALDGTEHSARGIRIEDAVRKWKTDSIKLRSDLRIARRTNDRKLRGFSPLPQTDHVTEQ